MAVPVYRISRTPLIGSKVISGGYTDTHTHTHTHTQREREREVGDLISPLSFFESKLKKNSIHNYYPERNRQSLTTEFTDCSNTIKQYKIITNLVFYK
jgi:hypothetical protein